MITELAIQILFEWTTLPFDEFEAKRTDPEVVEAEAFIESLPSEEKERAYLVLQWMLDEHYLGGSEPSQFV